MGDWFCKECQKQKDKEAKLNNPEPKPEPPKKRRIFKEEVSDEESSEQSSVKSEPQKKRRIFKLETSDDESSEQSDDNKPEPVQSVQDIVVNGHDEEITEMEDEELDESQNVDVCTKCGTEGTLLCCDTCPGMYHLECADPPLRRVPRGQWLCHKCKIKKSKETLGMFIRLSSPQKN